MVDLSAFTDVRDLPEGAFSLPELKWRELVFIGALRAEDGGFVRDPGRPLPPFAREGLFPEGMRFEVERHGDRIVIRSKGRAAREL